MSDTADRLGPSRQGPLRRAIDAATVSGYKAGSAAARLVPGPVSNSLAAPFGLGANLTSPEKRSMIMRHLRRVDPDMGELAVRRAAQQAFDSYARYYIESFRLPSLSSRTVAAGIRTEGYEEYVVPALDRGAGVILALPHLGGWEWAGRWLTDRGHRVSAVVERIEPPELFEWFAELRAALGMTVIPLGAGAGKAVLSALKDNEIVCLLCDRDIQRTGVEVEFFGEHTTLPAGPATLGLRTDAPVLPTAVYFTGRRTPSHFGLVRPPLALERTDRSLRDDVADGTQLLARELEVLIRRDPSQWHLFQPNWPSDPGYGVA